MRVQSLSVLAHRHQRSFSRSAIAGMVQWRRTLLAHCCTKALGLQAFQEELWQAASAETIRAYKLLRASALIFYLYQRRLNFFRHDYILASPPKEAIIEVNYVARTIQLVLSHCYLGRSVSDCTIALWMQLRAFVISLQIIFRQRRCYI